MVDVLCPFFGRMRTCVPRYPEISTMKIKAATGGNKKILFPTSPRGAALLCPILTTPPLQWSSEFTDTNLGLVYYNYRHYNPLDGRWTGRDLNGIFDGLNDFLFVLDIPMAKWDSLGLASKRTCCKCGKSNLGGMITFAKMTNL